VVETSSVKVLPVNVPGEAIAESPF